jgi:hypothetical protein
VAYYETRNGKPTRQPVEITVLDALARGVDTVPALAQAVGESVQAVDAAVTWAVGKGFAARMQLMQGEHITITESGLASVANQRALEAAIRPDGSVDVAALSRQTAAAWQAAQQGRAAALADSQEHVLVDDAEREAAAASLREHYAEGAVDLAELERRVALALAAKTRGDLRTALADLEPETPAAAASPLPPGFGNAIPDIAAALPPDVAKLFTGASRMFNALFVLVFAFGFLTVLINVLRG